MEGRVGDGKGGEVKGVRPLRKKKKSRRLHRT